MFHSLPNELLSQIFAKIYKKISGLFFDRCLIFKVRLSCPSKNVPQNLSNKPCFFAFPAPQAEVPVAEVLEYHTKPTEPCQHISHDFAHLFLLLYNPAGCLASNTMPSIFTNTSLNTECTGQTLRAPAFQPGLDFGALFLD